MNGRLSIEELAQRREEILTGIQAHGECWEIGDGTHDGFVLGPPDLLNNVLGLVDEEYGWPVTVNADAPIEEFKPRLRGHPFIVRDQELIAIAVSKSEYRDICSAAGKPIDDTSINDKENNEINKEKEINYPTDVFTSHPTKAPDET